MRPLKTFKNLNENYHPFDYKREGEIFIGYFTINSYKKLGYNTKRIWRNPNDHFVVNLKLFPVYIQKWEWVVKNRYNKLYPVKRYILKGEICYKKHILR
jgi:hypothetical protein